MKLLLGLDSRVANKGGFLLMDVETGQYCWREYPFEQDFKRLGFRGFHLAGDRVYAVNAAALYIIDFDFGPGVEFAMTPRKVVQRPEWRLGDRAHADLHDVFYRPDRRQVLVANSYMDAIDVFSSEGELLERRYLWDIAEHLWALAERRAPEASDLAHVNHIEQHQGRILLTLGNLNATRRGQIIRMDTGEILVDGLRFPHDGVVADGTLYVTNTETAEIDVYEDFDPVADPGRSPTRTLRAEIPPGPWDRRQQWPRGVAVCDDYVIVGATQLRGDIAAGLRLAPPRLAIFDRAAGGQVADAFLPKLEGFPNPCIYTVVALDPAATAPIERDAIAALWPAPEPDENESAGGAVEIPNARLRGRGWPRKKLRHWIWSPADAPVQVRFRDDDTALVLNFAGPEDKAYLSTGHEKAGITYPADPVEMYRLEHPGPLTLQAEVSECDFLAQAGLFLLLYDQAGQCVAKESVRLKPGRNTVCASAEGEAASYRVALRLSGKGTVALRSLKLRYGLD